jgi:glycosyltransferase involved in cell wall biosynthesis
MAKRDISNFDASDRAASELEYVLRRNTKTEAAPRISVAEAVSRPRVFRTGVARTATRVLFVSQDTSLLNPEKQSLDGFLNLHELFEEVHILILRQGIKAKNPVLRVAPNVWLYTASAKSWFGLSSAGVKIAQEEMVFAAGFRPDLIVARDPFESAIVAHEIATLYKRPAQVHILEDYTTNHFKKHHRHVFLRRLIAGRMIKKFASVRVVSLTVKQMLSKRISIPDLDVLPRYNNYQAIIDTAPTLDLKQTYKPFAFIMLYVGKLSYASTFFRAIDAARFALKNPRVGIVVLGDGPAKKEFHKRSKVLDIEKQVVFDTKTKDIIPHLKSSDFLIVTDTDHASDEIILKAAAAGTPVVMSSTPKREELFEHGVSAYLCEETDVQAFADRINDLLNNPNLRQVISDRAQQMMKEKFHQDAQQYTEAYRTSIEQALFVEDDSRIQTS